MTGTQAKDRLRNSQGNNMVVPEGHPPVSEVSDLEQPTTTPTFESWLQHFDQASSPKELFLHVVVK